MNAWVTHLSAGIQAGADMLLAAWTMANAVWSGRLDRVRRRLGSRARDIEMIAELDRQEGREQ